MTFKVFLILLKNETSIVEAHDPVRILEILFKQTQRSNMITIESDSYSKYEQLDDLGTKKKSNFTCF